jgi:uncharacterized protein YgiM (DUF1202 family)
MTLRSRTRHVRSVLPVAGLCLAAALSPFTALADTDLTQGGMAVVAYANGDNVRVRTGPAADAPIVGEVAEGSSVYVIDGTYAADDGSLWYQVEANGVTGYMVSDYLANSGALLASTSGDAMTVDAVNVRTGPSLGDPIIGTPPAGTWLPLGGENINGWLLVTYNGYYGYVYSAFLTQDGETAMDGSGAVPVVDEPVVEERVPTGEVGTRYTNDSVNLRSGASLEESVITVLPAGFEVWLTGAIGNGFAQVESGQGTGWIATEYLSVDPPAPDEPVVEEPVAEEPAAPAPSSSLIAWPVSGGEWRFLQGYNGSSHQDSGLWQYGDSIDLVRTDGSTAGQPIYSPVNGTIRWFDPATGGVSIDMGNGYAFAMFHAYYDGGLQEGDTVTQGQYIGTIAPAGEAASGSNAHLHIAVWATEDGGNWSRTSVPFTGALAISGNEYYNSGIAFEHTGTIVYP